MQLFNYLKKFKGIDIFFLSLILLIPAALISGPFLPDLFIVVLSLGFFYKAIKLDLKKYLYNKYTFLFISFWFYISIRSLFTEDVLLSIKSSLFYIRFFVFSLLIFYFVEKYKKNFFYLFFFFLLFTIIFVLFDTLAQFFFGKDIFGYEKLKHRLSGPFGNELVVGAYLARVSPLIIVCYYYLYEKLPYKILILFSLISPTIFITGERTSFFIFNFFLFFLIIFSIKKNKIKFLFLILGLILFIISVFLIFNKDLKDRMIHIPACEMRIKFLYGQNCLSNGKDEIQEEKDLSNKNYYIFSQTHEAHYKSAFKMFLDNKLFGVGVKMFRVLCSDIKYYTFNGCTTHPHNLLIQILSETGLVGFLFLIIVVFYIYLNIFKIGMLILKNKNKPIHNVQIFLLIMMAQSFLFFLPAGQFFNNWNAIIIFLPLGFYLSIANKKN